MSWSDMFWACSGALARTRARVADNFIMMGGLETVGRQPWVVVPHAGHCGCACDKVRRMQKSGPKNSSKKGFWRLSVKRKQLSNQELLPQCTVGRPQTGLKATLPAGAGRSPGRRRKSSRKRWTRCPACRRRLPGRYQPRCARRLLRGSDKRLC